MSETPAPTPATNLVDLIDQLIEPPAPEPISMLPQTWGWAALGLLIAAGLLFAGLRKLKSWHANAYRRAAVTELQTADLDSAGIAAVLRRTALAAYPRAQVASLTGPDWIAFLEATGAPGLSPDVAAELTQAPYAAVARPASAALRAAAQTWVRVHTPDRPA